MFSPRVLHVGLVAAGLTTFASAGDFMADLNAAADGGDWSFRITPYAWAAGVSGEFSQFGLPPVQINDSFSDVMEHLDLGAMAVFEAWHGRFGIFADLMHVRMSGSGQAVGLLPVAVPIAASATSTTGTLAAQFRWINDEAGYLDLIGGLRYSSLRIRLSAGAPVNISLSETERWADPMVGVKGLRWISEKTYLTGWAMLGGHAGGAEPVIDLMAGIGYQLTERLAILLAYRHLTVDYREGAFLYDSTQQGFGIGIDFYF